MEKVIFHSLLMVFDYEPNSVSIFILTMLQYYIPGVGKVNVSGNTCVYTISDLTSLKDVLCPLLFEHGLFTSKWLDFLAFAEKVKYLSSNSSVITGDALVWAKQLISSLNSTRTVYDSTLPIVINRFWLLGFIEAEGTFGFKNLSRSFQVGQHIRSLAVIEAIRVYITYTRIYWYLRLSSTCSN